MKQTNTHKKKKTRKLMLQKVDLKSIRWQQMDVVGAAGASILVVGA